MLAIARLPNRPSNIYRILNLAKAREIRKQPALTGGLFYFDLKIPIVDMIGNLFQVAHIEPLSAAGAFHVVVGLSLRDSVNVPAGLHRNDSFTLRIAGCFGFFTLTQFGNVPARQLRSRCFAMWGDASARFAPGRGPGKGLSFCLMKLGPSPDRCHAHRAADRGLTAVIALTASSR
jgi:hypothetical protein